MGLSSKAGRNNVRRGAGSAKSGGGIDRGIGQSRVASRRGQRTLEKGLQRRCDVGWCEAARGARRWRVGEIHEFLVVVREGTWRR